jgi:hypothetical protein
LVWIAEDEADLRAARQLERGGVGHLLLKRNDAVQHHARLTLRAADGDVRAVEQR